MPVFRLDHVPAEAALRFVFHFRFGHCILAMAAARPRASTTIPMTPSVSTVSCLIVIARLPPALPEPVLEDQRSPVPLQGEAEKRGSAVNANGNVLAASNTNFGRRTAA